MMRATAFLKTKPPQSDKGIRVMADTDLHDQLAEVAASLLRLPQEARGFVDLVPGIEVIEHVETP